MARSLERDNGREKACRRLAAGERAAEFHMEALLPLNPRARHFEAAPCMMEDADGDDILGDSWDCLRDIVRL